MISDLGNLNTFNNQFSYVLMNNLNELLKKLDNRKNIVADEDSISKKLILT